MWHSFRDLATAELYVTEFEIYYEKLYPLDVRTRRYKENFNRCKRFAGYNTVKKLYEEAESFDDRHIVYMSARDFWERFLDEKEQKRAHPASIGQLLNLAAHIYNLEIIRVWDYGSPDSKTKCWIKLYPIPTRLGWN